MLQLFFGDKTVNSDLVLDVVGCNGVFFLEVVGLHNMKHEHPDHAYDAENVETIIISQ
jgi:hypothetical protein